MIKAAKKSDLKKIVAMKLEMFREAGVDEGLSNNVEIEILKTYNKLYSNNKMKHFIIQKEDEIVACAGGFIKDDIPHLFFKPSFYGFIGDVYTYPQHRKKGFATKLTKRVIKWLKEKNVVTIRLFTSQAGKKIYQKLGFEMSDEMILKL